MTCAVCSDFDAQLSHCADGDLRARLRADYREHRREHLWFMQYPWFVHPPIYDILRGNGGCEVLWTYSRMVAMTRTEWEAA